MQKMNGMPGSLGHLIPNALDGVVEERFVRWLNNAEPSELRGGTKRIIPDSYDEGDPQVRKKITEVVLPLITRMQRIPQTDEEFFEKGAAVLKRSGIDAASPDSMPAVFEALGFRDKAKLLDIFAKHSLIRLPAFAGKPAALLSVGRDATEAWAANVLVLLGEAGRLDKLKVCDCGCGRWFIKTRTDGRFAVPNKCRGRYHQADEKFKAARRQAAKNRYKDEKDGKVVRGWHKTVGGRQNAKTAK